MPDNKIIKLFDRFSQDFYAQFPSPEEVVLDTLWEIHNQGHYGYDCPYDCPYRDEKRRE